LLDELATRKRLYTIKNPERVKQAISVQLDEGFLIDLGGNSGDSPQQVQKSVSPRQPPTPVVANVVISPRQNQPQINQQPQPQPYIPPIQIVSQRNPQLDNGNVSPRGQQQQQQPQPRQIATAQTVVVGQPVQQRSPNPQPINQNPQNRTPNQPQHVVANVIITKGGPPQNVIPIQQNNNVVVSPRQNQPQPSPTSQGRPSVQPQQPQQQGPPQQGQVRNSANNSNPNQAQQQQQQGVISPRQNGPPVQQPLNRASNGPVSPRGGMPNGPVSPRQPQQPTLNRSSGANKPVMGGNPLTRSSGNVKPVITQPTAQRPSGQKPTPTPIVTQQELEQQALEQQELEKRVKCTLCKEEYPIAEVYLILELSKMFCVACADDVISRALEKGKFLTKNALK